MAGQADKSDESLEKLLQRIGQLEDRVAALENRPQPPAIAPADTFFGEKLPEKVKRKVSTSAVPVFGKAVLAIAGAYLLRAMADSAVAPRWVLQMLAVTYAGAWLVTAARAHRKSAFASTIFALTAAAILAPLLWEGTARFHELTPSFTVLVLVGFVLLSLALAWKENLQVVPWIAVVVTVLMMLALLPATRELKILTMGLLAIAFITELAGWNGHWLGLRVVAAFGANAALLVLGIIMTSADGVPAGYQPISAGEISLLGAILLFLYTASLAVRGFVWLKNWNFVEVALAVVACLSGAWIILRATQSGTAQALGATFLTLAVVFYWGALNLFKDIPWNRRFSQTYAAGLMLAGSFLPFSGNPRTILLSLLALAAVIAFTRTGSLTFEFHGVLYLLAACIAGGLLQYIGRALAGTVPAWPGAGFWMVVGAGLFSYLLGSRTARESGTPRLLNMVFAGAVALGIAALAIVGFTAMAGGELGASRLSMVRTMVTCVLALTFGYAGSRWNRVELGWVAYAIIGLGALKLVLEDLRFGNAATLMVSLLFYGLILILLPRLTRFGRVEV